MRKRTDGLKPTRMETQNQLEGVRGEATRDDGEEKWLTCFIRRERF